MTTTLNAVPIVNLPFLYINNLNVTNNATTPNTKIDVSSGQCRDSTNTFDMVLGSSVTINAAVNGANGLDTGSLAASTWYYVHLISDPVSANATAALLSLSRTAPTLPAGYEAFRWIGVARTDGSTHFLLNYVTGNGSFRTQTWDSVIATDISAGTSTSLALASCTASIPPIDNTQALFKVSYTPATANDYVSLAPVGSSSTSLPSLSGVVASKVQTGTLPCIAKLSSSVSKIQYINSAGSGSTAISTISFNLSL